MASKKTFSVELIRTPEWAALRLLAFAKYGAKCQKCGSVELLQADHVKPKNRYPELALDINNLQILCWPCNREKASIDESDYRPQESRHSNIGDGSLELISALLDKTKWAKKGPVSGLVLDPKNKLGPHKRWAREEYNRYQREYMKKRRDAKRKEGVA